MFLCDESTRAFARAAASASGAAARILRPPRTRPRVIVLGLGSHRALTAARSGVEVVWYVRVARYAEVAAALLTCNRLDATRVKIVVCKRSWEDAPSQLPPTPSGELAREAEAVLTEEIGDDPLADGVLPLARLGMHARGCCAPTAPSCPLACASMGRSARCARSP